MVLADHRPRGPRGLRRDPHRLELRGRVRSKLVDRDDDGEAERLAVGDVSAQVLAPLCDERDVLLGVRPVERLARGDGGTAAVHLECSDGGDEHCRVREQPGGAALDVDKLLEADVCAEAGLGDDEAGLADEPEADVVGEDGRVAVGDVCKGPRVDEDGRRLEGLHERRLLREVGRERERWRKKREEKKGEIFLFPFFFFLLRRKNEKKHLPRSRRA